MWDPHDTGAPVVVELRHSIRHTRKKRKFACGHTVPAGTLYTEWVGLVDGEFSVDTECSECWRERDVDML